MNGEHGQVGLKWRDDGPEERPRVQLADAQGEVGQGSAPEDGPRVLRMPLKRAGAAAPGEQRSQWGLAAVVLGLGLLSVLGLFMDTVGSMVHTWRTTSAYGHGFLIVPISLYLVWHRRERLAQAAPQPSLWGLAAMVPAAAAWLLGHMAGAQIIEQVALVLMIQAMVLAGLGCSIMPEFLPLLPGIATRALVEPEVARTISLATVAGRRHSPAVGALVRLAQRYPWPG